MIVVMRDSTSPWVKSVLRTVCIIIVTLFGLATYTFAEQGNRDLTKQSDVNAYVDESTGFGELKGITRSFEQVDINDDNTPFLHTQINGKKGVWLVEIKNVRLKLKSATSGFKDKYVRNFQVFVDPNTGHLLKITSTFDGNDPDMLPEPPAAVAEREMRGTNEIYHGFPMVPPKISLLDALDRVPMSPFLAKEIYAVYVMQSHRMGRKFGWGPRPMWAITLRGIPPLPVKGPPGLRKEDLPPVWQSNHARVIVDASTGQLMFSTNIPQPLPPEEKQKK